MSIAETDWQSKLSPDSDLPPDVTFLVQGENGEDQETKIEAHKFLLAGVSPVFQGMFYGPMKETGEVVVKETTPEAFKEMVKYIYHPIGGEAFNLNHTRCPQELFELLNCANKYQISKLATLTSDALRSLSITRETMIFTATVSRKYHGTAFNDLSTELMMKCVKFLLDTSNGGGDVLALVKETEANFPEANFEILRDLRAVAKTVLQLPDWGNLVFFDTQEHQIPNVRHELVTIPKLETQWKILYDVKRTEHLQVENPRKYYDILSIWVGRDANVRATVSPTEIFLGGYLFGDDNQLLAQRFVTGNQVPNVGEWTRIEIGHEEEDGKYFLSLAVGGEHVGREEVTDLELKNPTDVKINIGNRGLSPPLPGFLRGVVVLQK